jgi:SEC-C motif-containing protein
MRSRFAAFARGDVEYLWRTLDAEHEDRAHPREEALAALRDAARRHKYMGLTILDAEGERVLFLARVFERGADRSFVERSVFAHDGTGWRYRDGDAIPAREVSDPTGLTLATFRPA